MMQKVLVTGAAGQLGQSFQKLQPMAASLGIELLFASRQQLDLSRPEVIAAYLQNHAVDVVVNTAAYTAVDKAETDAEQAALINAEAAAELARQCQAAGNWLVHISTDYVFDGQSDQPYEETDATNPLGVYGQTKLDGEIAVSEFCPDALILRTSWVFSEFGNNFLKTMLRLATDRDELGVVADQTGAPTYAPHIAEAVLRLIHHRAEYQQKIPGIYHFSGDCATNWCEFARSIFASAACSVPDFRSPLVNAITTADYPTPAQRPQNSVLSTAKLESLLGSLNNSWSDGIDQAIARLV